MTMRTLDISAEEYHNRPEISSGFVRSFMINGPWVAYHQYVLRTLEDTDSDTKRLGRIFHLAMEDPNTVDDKVVIMPEAVPNDWGEPSKAEEKQMSGDTMPFQAKFRRHREFRDTYLLDAEEAGKELMTPADKHALVHMVESVWANPACREYLGTPLETHEVPCFNTDEKTGLELKALADILLEDIIIDFKSTRMSTALTFVRDARKKGYHYQGDHYRRVSEKQRHLIVAVRNVEPWESMIYEIDAKMMAAASEDNDQALWSIKNSYETDSWHSLGWGALQELSYEGVVL